MQTTNYLPVHTLSNSLYELYVGFSSTHPRADKWVETRLGFMRDAFGPEVTDLIDQVTNLRTQVDTGDVMVDCDAVFKSIDALLVSLNKRPPGWVPCGEVKSIREFGNGHMLIDLWAGAEVMYAKDDEDGPRMPDVADRQQDLRRLLPLYGDLTKPWVLEIEADGEHVDINTPPAGFKHIGDGFYANGLKFQWSCAQGRATAYEGTYQK